MKIKITGDSLRNFIDRVWRILLRIGGSAVDGLYGNLWMCIFYMLQLGGVALYVWSPEGLLSFSIENLIRGMRSACLPALILMICRGLILYGDPGRLRRLSAGLLTSLTILPCMAETWMSFELHTRLSDRIVRLIVDTNGGEAGEFFRLYLFTPKSIGILLGYLLLSKIIYDFLKATGHWLRLSENRKIRIAQKAVGIFAVAAGIWWWSLPRENDFDASNSTNTLVRIERMIEVYDHTRKSVKALEKTPALADGSIKEGRIPPHRIIWVIGESDSKAHWSLYGYGLPTTPKMDSLYAEGSLLKYDDVICYEPRTYRMMEILFSPHVLRDKYANYLKTPLTPMILRKAGYVVRLHDNQATLVRGDDQAEVGTSNFMNSRKLSEANFDYRNERMYRYDMDLIEEAIRLIQSESDGGIPTVDIIHINGQHFSAENRYPEGFGIFGVEDYSGRKDLSREEKAQVAAYDNATRYVDGLLARLMEEMKDEDAVIIYHPDHGEEMNDERHCHVRTMDSHKLPKSAPYVLEIPFLVYTSPSFRDFHTDLYERLQSAAGEKQSLVYFSHFLLDVAEVDSKYKRPKNSPLSKEWIRPSRVVKEIGDYDKWKEKNRVRSN